MSLLTSFPTVTGNFLKFNFKQASSDLANAVGNDSWDGIIKDEKIDLGNLGGPVIGTYKDLLEGNLIDNTNNKYYEYIDYYKGIGDPRYPTNAALSAVFLNFMPRIEAYTELVNSGGCKIVNGYICNQDGVPVAKATTNCINNINTEHIKPKEIETFIQTSYDVAFKKESDSFINYVKTNYTNNGWILELIDMSQAIFVKLSKIGNDDVIIKYFYDQKDYLSTSFNTPIKTFSLNLMVSLSGSYNQLFTALSNPAPVYNTY
jgi:hypothetical protein